MTRLITTCFAFFALACATCSSGVSEQSRTCGPGTIEFGNVCVPAPIEAGHDSYVEAATASEGGEAGVDSDASEQPGTEGGLDGGEVTHVNWTSERGSPIALQDWGPIGKPFVLTDTLLGVAQSIQQPSNLRTLLWMDDSKSVVSLIESSMPAGGVATTRDGQRMLELSDAVLLCQSAGGMVMGGRIKLVETETGNVLWTGPAGESNSFPVSAFTDRDYWFTTSVSSSAKLCPDSGGPILPAMLPEEHRLVSAPNNPIAKLPDYFSHYYSSSNPREVAEDLWIATVPIDDAEPQKGYQIGFLNPKVDGSFVPVATDNALFSLMLDEVGVRYANARYVETYGGQRWGVLTVDLTTQTACSQWLLPDGYTGCLYKEQWLVCRPNDSGNPMVHTWMMHDGSGAVADAQLEVLADLKPEFVEGNLLAYGTQKTGETSHSLVLVNLDDGQRREYALDVRNVLAVSDRTAAVTSRSGELWIVDDYGPTLVAQGVVATQSWKDAVGIIRINEADQSYSLELFESATRTRVSVTDHLYYLKEGPECSMPGLVPMAGNVVFFGERRLDASKQVELFVMPRDASAPPRSLGTIDTSSCRAPMVSRTASRVASIAYDSSGDTSRVRIGSL